PLMQLHTSSPFFLIHVPRPHADLHSFPTRRSSDLRLKRWNLTQIQHRTEFMIIHQFRHGIRYTTCTDIMYRHNRVLVLHAPASINHVLTTAFHFRVFTLYRSEIQVFAEFTAVYIRCCTSAETDQRGRATEHDQ